MTSQSVSAQYAALVSAMRDGFAAVAAVEAIAAVQRETDIDQLRVLADATAQATRSLLPLLQTAARAGHVIRVECVQPDAVLSIGWTRLGQASLDLTGSPRDLVAPAEATSLEGAIVRGDASAALELLGVASVQLDLSLRPPEGTGHWIASTADLIARLKDGRWASTLRRLMDETQERSSFVVIHDAADALLVTSSITFLGPDASSTGISTPASGPTSEKPYLDSRISSGIMAIPSPGNLVPRQATTDPLIPLATLLRQLARASAWYWLSHTSHVTADSVTVQFHGVRAVELDLRPFGDGAPTHELNLFGWAAAVSDPARQDALQQAVTFAVRDAADLNGAAQPVLRTARSLHELASRGAVAEALATRRAAREAAIAGARGAALAARDVGAKAVERTMALLLAATLAMIANERDLLSTSATIAIVVAAGLFTLVALFVAERIELDSGAQLLTAFDVDIELYREALSTDDIQSVRNLDAIRAAHDDLKRSRFLVRWLYGAVAALIVVGGIPTAIASHSSGSKSSSNTTRPTTTTSPSQPAPSGSRSATPTTPQPIPQPSVRATGGPIKAVPSATPPGTVSATP